MEPKPNTPRDITSTDVPQQEKSLVELYGVWNDSQSYIAEQNIEIIEKLDKLNKNLNILLNYIKAKGQDDA